jgi:hypothetical protein
MITAETATTTFPSACLRAAFPWIIPEIISEKYYSDEVNESHVAAGRTPSWTSVDGFYNYCKNNTKRSRRLDGLRAVFGEVGDIVQISATANGTIPSLLQK